MLRLFILIYQIIKLLQLLKSHSIMIKIPLLNTTSKNLVVITLFLVILAFTIKAFAGHRQVGNSVTDPNMQVMHWTVDGVDREAIVYIPPSAKTAATPVIFAFHGFGSSMQIMYKSHRFDEFWPEAIVVWPQGLDIPGGRISTEAKPGWQLRAGTSNDRDLHFFDTMLKSMQENYKVDDKRIYATGHSNGAGFTLLLWETRGDILAAVVPSAAPNFNIVKSLQPKPDMQITGETDQVVNPEKQLEMFNTVLKINSCNTVGQNYGGAAMYYSSASGNPTVLYKHPGGHVYPKDAIPVVIRFFKSNMKK